MHIYKSLKLGALVLFIVTVAFFAGCGGGTAPPINHYGTAGGFVKDAVTRTGIEEAIVTIGDKSNITDSNGAYLIENIPAGSQSIVVTALGYQDYNNSVTIEEGDNVIDDVLLEPGATHYEDTSNSDGIATFTLQDSRVVQTKVIDVVTGEPIPNIDSYLVTDGTDVAFLFIDPAGIYIPRIAPEEQSLRALARPPEERQIGTIKELWKVEQAMYSGYQPKYADQIESHLASDIFRWFFNFCYPSKLGDLEFNLRDFLIEAGLDSGVGAVIGAVLPGVAGALVIVSAVELGNTAAYQLWVEHYTSRGYSLDQVFEIWRLNPPLSPIPFVLPIEEPSNLVIEENPGSISGKVLDALSLGIHNAQVEIVDLDLSTTTSSDGSYSFSSIPPGTYGIVAYKIGYNPSAQVNVRVFSGQETAALSIVLSSIVASNHAPVITSTPVTSATVNQLYSYDVDATDPEDDSLTYSLTTKPTEMSINSSTGLVTWTPSTTGDYDVTVKVSDGELFDYQSFTITVQSENIILSYITVSPSIMSLVEGDTQTITSITAHYNNEDTANIALNDCTYDSSNTGVATVNTGVITAFAPGTATITVSYTEGGITKTDTVAVTVNAITPTPAMILSPVVGNLEIVSSIEQCSNTKWCFNQHKSGYHCQGGGICQADDTYAWDANLNTPNFDSDNGKPIYAVEQGVVSQTFGGCINAGGSYGQLLIEHTYQGNPWWSGYLHLKDIQVTTGQSVDQNTLLGYISNTSPKTIPNHLHFVVYKGQNSPSELISFDTNIIPRDFPQTYYTITASAGPHGSISPSGDVIVNQGSDKLFTVTPDTGYQIDDILVDGSSVGAASSYTFTNVTQDHTISVTFTSVAPGLVHNINKGTYYNTIQSALDDADNDNTIEVSNGTYDESITFPFIKKIILRSINGASSTIIRGNEDSTTVISDSPREGTTLEGFTITHASGNKGRGIYTNGNLIIKDCTISSNFNNDDGAGIYNYKGTITITGSTISGNSNDILFSVWDSGGGIYNNYGSITITGSTISDNASDWNGGGINNRYGTITITESTISGNSADGSGGGIYNQSGSITITGSTISGNSVYYGGGGIYNYYCSITITGSTISGNSTYYGDGGIYFSYWTSGTLPIGGSSDAEKNTICGNYKIGEVLSLDQQIRDYSGSLYDTYKDTNYISVYCE